MEEIVRSKKIVLVDTDTSYIVQLRNALSKAGYEVICWDDGQKALDLIKNTHVDMIISEVELAQINGHTLFKEIRSIPSYQTTPFIFLSNQKRVDDRIKSIELGVDDYITKPFFIEEIVARIEALFAEIAQLSEEQTQSEQGFSGNLTEMNLVDLIQTMELGKKSAILKLKHDFSIGLVYIEDGAVIDSSLQDLPPEEAIMRMFTWTIGAFSVELTSVNRERTIHKPNKELITFGLRRINQWEQLKRDLPPLNTVVTRTDQNTYENLSEDEKALIIEINDEKKTICEIIEKSRFDDLKALELVKSLYQKGYLQETDENYIPYTDHYLARLKQHASHSRTTRERVASIIANVLNESGDGKKNSSSIPIERRQLLDRRKYGRRRDDRLHEPAQIYLTKSDLLMIRERLS